MRGVWSSREHEILKEMYELNSRAEIIAAIPGRSWNSICQQAHYLGLQRRGKAPDYRRRLKIDRDGLVELYWNQNLSQDEIARRFSCNQRAVYQLMRRLEIPVKESSGGDKRDLVWTEEENEIIRQHYKMALRQTLLVLLPKRSWQNVVVQACKLGIKRTIRRFDADNSKITELYYEDKLSQYEIGQRLGVSRAAIEKRMNKAGLEARTAEQYSRLAYYKHNKGPSLMSGLRAAWPTRPEKRVIRAIQDYSLPFKYVGNSGLCINGLYPDFVSTNGNKVIIEVFGRVFHDPLYSVRPLRPQATEKVRHAIYAKVGYKMLVFWDDELDALSDIDIRESIVNFIKVV